MTPTADDIRVAAVLLGCDPGEVPVALSGVYGHQVVRTIASTVGDLECEVCHAAPGEPCDMTVNHEAT